MPRKQVDIYILHELPAYTAYFFDPFLVLQQQETRKNNFLFVYSGPTPDANARQDLDIKHFECFKDPSTSYVNAVIITNGRYRVSSFQAKLEQINASRLSENNKFILRKQSEVDDEIMVLERSDGITTLKKHFLYKRIQDAKNREDPTYYKWPNTDEEYIERKTIKELHIDMVKPSGKAQRKSGEKPETKTATYSFDSDDDEGAAGAAGGVEASPATPVRPRSQLGLRKKRMAYRIYEDDEDDVGVAEGEGSGSAQAAAPALPAAAAEPVAAPAAPVAAPVAPAAEPAPVPVPRPVAPAQLPFAVYQIACNAIEARMKDKDEMHAEIMKVKHEMYAEIIKTKDEKHSELMKAQEEISKLKEEKYLEIIQSSTDCFKRLMDEKDEKYTHVYEMVGHLENAYKRPRSSS